VLRIKTETIRTRLAGEAEIPTTVLPLRPPNAIALAPFHRGVDPPAATGQGCAAMSLFVDHRNVVARAWRANFGATTRAA
jgi:hypothetical protein